MKKTKIFLLMLLSWMMAAGAMAEEQGILTVKLSDGSKVQFVLPVQQPVVNCEKSVMTICLSNSSEPSMSFSRDEVESLVVGESEIDGLRETSADEPRIRFDMTRQGMVRVSGLNDGDRLMVASVSGRQVQPTMSRNGSEAVIDLSGQPRGCYIVSVNKRFSFKLMKP